MLNKLEHNQWLRNREAGPLLTVRSRSGLANTNPVATSGATLGSGAPVIQHGRYRFLKSSFSSLLDEERGTLEELNSPFESFDLAAPSPTHFPDYHATTHDKPKVPGQVVLFKKIMEDWDFGMCEAAILLGFESSSDVQDIYDGRKSIGSRDANDRLRAILRIATDLDALFQDVLAIRDWLNEAQKDLSGATPRALLQEGSMENLLSVKYYVSHLSGR